MDLKVTLNGTTYTAPAPMMREFKQYIKFLRTAARKWANGAVPRHYELQVRHYMSVMNIDVAFIACLFQDKAVTPEALDSADFATGEQLLNGYSQWLAQYMPKQTAKNGVSR